MYYIPFFRGKAKRKEDLGRIIGILDLAITEEQ